jgi:uncharacterized protein (TIGR00645 family)
MGVAMTAQDSPPPSLPERAERAFETAMFEGRWLMAPFYLGLMIALAALMVNFVGQLLAALPTALTMDTSQIILWILTLIDLSLTANLILIVVFSGYENFVSKMDIKQHRDRPDWMGKIDFTGLKLKLIASVVAISGIHLLKSFMNIGQPGYALNEAHLLWLVVIHMAFVLSGLLLAAMDWIAASASAKGQKARYREE